MALIMMIPLATYKNINMKEGEEEEKRKFSNYQRKEKKICFNDQKSTLSYNNKDLLF